MKDTSPANAQYLLLTKRGSPRDRYKDRGFLAADNTNLYVLSLDKKIVKTIPLKTISKVRIKWRLMYVYTHWWFFISRANVFGFELSQTLIKKKRKNRRGFMSPKRYQTETHINNEPPEFAQWEKFFKAHGIKVSMASWVYYEWMNW